MTPKNTLIQIRSRLLIFLLCFAGSFSCVQTASAAEIIRQRLGFSPGLREYEIELIRLSLKAEEVSQESFRLTSIYHESSMDRILTEVNRGAMIHVTINTFNADKNLYPNIGTFELPESRILLGFRQFIVRKKDQARFDEVKTLKDLISLRPGQAQEWSDNAIYQHSGFPLVTSVNYGQLYPMLTGKRFDYLPLGVLEMQQAFHFEKDRFPGLAPIDGIYIYYPHKIFVHYYKGSESSASKIGPGLQKIFANGTEEKLFMEQFGDKFDRVDRRTARIFMLENPDYSSEENRRLSEQFLKHFNFQNNAIWVEPRSQAQ